MNNKTMLRRVPNTDNQITFLYEPNSTVVELLFLPDGNFKFLVKDINGTSLQDSYLDYSLPSKKCAHFVERGVIALPSAAEPFGSNDRLFQSIREFIHKYFACTPDFEVVATLFVLVTWLYEDFSAVPYLRFLGQPESGKSRALNTIGAISNRGLVLNGTATGASLFRTVDMFGGTLIMDEADFQQTQVGSDIAKILNCGYEQGKPIIRNNTTQNGFEPTSFDVFGPKLIGGRETFRDHAVESRCIRYMPMPPVDRPDISRQLPASFSSQAESIRNQALQWRLDNLDSVVPLERIRDEDLSARTEQIFIPLLTVAELLSAELRSEVRQTVLAYAVTGNRVARAERGESPEALLLQAWLRMKYERPRTIELCTRVKTDFGVDISYSQAGSILNGMGFDNKRTNRGSVRSLKPEKEADLVKRFGLDLNESDAGDSGDGLMEVAA